MTGDLFLESETLGYVETLKKNSEQSRLMTLQRHNNTMSPHSEAYKDKIKIQASLEKLT